MSPNEQIRFLKELSEAMSAASPQASPHSVMEFVFPKITSFLHADIGVISVLGEDFTLQMTSQQGEENPSVVLNEARNCLCDAIANKAVATGRGEFIADLASSPGLPEQAVKLALQEGIAVLVYTPLQAGNRRIGVMIHGWQEPIAFSEQDFDFYEVVGNILGFGIYKTQLIENLKAREEELQEACRAAIDAQEIERKRLSRELHDEIGQAITAILVRLKTLQDETDLELIQDRLNGLRYITAHTLEEVRRLSSDLRPAVFDDLGLVPAIRWYIDTYCSNTGLQINFQANNIEERLPGDLETAIYRAVQEGLTNISRHAQAKTADILLQLKKDEIILVISDDGKGMQQPLSYSNGLGLIGMQERIRLLGGQFDIKSEPDQGVKITIVLPVEK
ncbi:MAG TPA: GAF domain-containing sensor histidine kinase [Syntrophomonadaceae bacterium]|nr:GAF domain-containing sensor histidine kinase [Syntrophomonadaceae bacterium]